MKRSRAVIVLFFLAVVVVLIWWWFRPSQSTSVPFESNPSQSSNVAFTTPSTVAPQRAKLGGPVRNLPDTNQQKAYIAAFLTPISFWGKVVDEKGNPVPDVSVKLGANDSPNPMNDGSTYERKTDANGLFSITGIHGITLGVDVSKEGYYTTEQSSGSAHYVVKGKSDIPVPTKENPAVFVLHKMGITEPLIWISDRGYLIQKNGTPVEVDLATGQLSSQGNLRVEAWTENENKSPGFHRFNWRCRVSVPNGGLVERKGQFDFEAPTDDYKPFDEIVMSQTAKQWQSQVRREYFLKLNDGRYARINFVMIAGGNHYFNLETYLNPKPGSRNLEFDKKKALAPH